MRTRVRAGDPSVFAELFDAYSRAVYNHAFRLTADWSTAEDVMATTFMEAWRLRGRVDPEGGSLRPWLLGIATNTARNQFRSNRRYRRAAGAAAAAETAVPDHADAVADRLDDRRRLATALTALATLRRPEREVIALCLGEGLDYEAAAEALGIPVGTVASRLSRARKKLRAVAEAQLAPPKGEAGRTVTGVAAEKVRGNREGPRLPRQTRGDHANAIRPAQEGNR
ncbi:RNA polymerase sigma factor [Streptomyces aurantiacus]|uniref:Siderophore-interacting protein n=1 Tax=Streptomyces aurantiacus TaxID=47760 RepID=A0A7G1NZX0_9ACTN|nr:RNA polymerase sigma factor [Streptomyces aurantiacus]BCL29043.1 siderophore-interacting protein [Streptomyces aurantiacus]